MDITALIVALTNRIPDLGSVILEPENMSEWFEVSNEHYAVTIERVLHTGKWGIYYPDSDESVRLYKKQVLGPDEVFEDALQLVDRVVDLFESDFDYLKK